MRWSPQELLRDTAHAFPGTPLPAQPRLLQSGSRQICGVSIDTRKLEEGALFIPLVAARDGHEFLEAAIKKGAAAVLVDAEHEACAAQLPPEITVIVVDDTQDALTRLACAQRLPAHPRICITGSNGKTTTRALLGAVLSLAYPKLQATSGNLNNHLGVPLTLLAGPAAPDARLIEFGMSALGENRHLSRILGPTIGVITSIALEHLEFMKSLENIAKAEAEPVHDLPPGSLLTIPFGEPVLEAALADIPGFAALDVIRVGFDPGADVLVKVDHIDERTHGSVTLPGQDPLKLALPMIGTHNLLNAGYALAVGQHLGIALPAMQKALEQSQVVGSRGKVIRIGPHQLIADCYNANPGSMKAALESLRHTNGSRARIAVLGDMFELGPTSPQLHRETMALATRQGLDQVFALGPLSVPALREQDTSIPRGYLPDNIQAAAKELATALTHYPQGATVLFKASRGMKLEALIEALQETPQAL